MTLTELSAAIAETGDSWIVPGVAVRDPENPSVRQWRNCGPSPHRAKDRDLWVGPFLPGGLCIHTDFARAESCDRAIAAGPDLTDLATIGALYMLIRKHDPRLTQNIVSLEVGVVSIGGRLGTSDAEAIGKCYLDCVKEPANG